MLYLVPLKADVSPAVRLRRLLKAALRAYGWRLVRMDGEIPDG